jgi:putative MFS transporter
VPPLPGPSRSAPRSGGATPASSDRPRLPALASGLSAAVQAQVDALPLNRRHALVFAVCSAGLFFESLNLQLMSFAAPMIAREWRIGPATLGIAISAAMFGMLVGTYLFGALADRYGRRLGFQVTVGIFSVVTAVSAASAGLLQLTAARFGAGLGIGGSIPVETAVLAEFSPARWRARLVALWAMALPLGALAAPLCVALMPATFNWRGLMLLGAAPAALVLILRRTIPETPQFLAARGRLAASEQALSWIARRPIALAAEPEPSPDRAAVGPREPPERLLFNAAHRRSTAMGWLLYFGSFSAYYGFVLWLPALLTGYRGFLQPELLRFMAGLALAGFAGRIGVLLLGGRLGQRTIIALCGVASVVALSAFATQPGRAGAYLWGYAAAFFLEGAFSVVIPFVADLYPSAARATGVGWAGGMGRLGAALAPLGVGLLLRSDMRYAVGLLTGGALLMASATLLGGRAPAARTGSGAPTP